MGRVHLSTTPQSENLPTSVPILRTISVRIRYMRMILGLSQAEPARRSQVTQASISYLESGRSHTTSRVAAIARTLGVTAYWLETGRDDMPSKDVAG
jgi:transcriptional regulator with XRE-family HTH domain